jgi:hypothetical protein
LQNITIVSPKRDTQQNVPDQQKKNSKGNLKNKDLIKARRILMFNIALTCQGQIMLSLQHHTKQ